MRILSFRLRLFLGAACACLSMAPLPGVTSDLVVAHFTTTSGASSDARAFGDGARLYFDRVNAQGGVVGARIAFEARDAATLDIGSPILLVGAVTRASVEPVVPVLERLQVPLLGPSIEANDAAAIESRYVFYLRPDAVGEIDALLDKVAGLGLRKLAVCAPHEVALAYVPGTPLASLERSAAPVAAQRCDGAEGDIEAAAQAIAAVRPQAVIVGGSTRDATVFVKALRARGSRAMVVTTSGIDSAALSAALAPAARMWVVGGETVPTLRRGKDGGAVSAVTEFLEIRNASGSKLAVSRASLAGFTTAKMAVEAIRRAGATPSGEKVRNALAAMQRFDAERLAANDTTKR
jgi:ABC-type branched-subunit amino acid transport system substrate-binding protein